MCRVILEGLSPQIEALLKQHNQDAVDNLVDYVTGYVSSHADSLPAANRLPLSGLCYPSPPVSSLPASEQQSVTGSKASAEVSHGRGSDALTQFRKPCRISSPFVALSGEFPLHDTRNNFLTGRRDVSSRQVCAGQAWLAGWVPCSGCLHLRWLWTSCFCKHENNFSCLNHCFMQHEHSCCSTIIAVAAAPCDISNTSLPNWSSRCQASKWHRFNVRASLVSHILCQACLQKMQLL